MHTANPITGRPLLTVVMYLLLLSILSCKPDHDKPSGGSNNGNNNPPDATNIATHTPSVLDTTRNILLITAQGAGGLTVVNDTTLAIASLAGIKNLNHPSEGEKNIAAIAVNDVLISDKSDRIASGLMASVTAVKLNTDGSWLVNFINTGLENIYKHLDLDWKKQLDTLQTKDQFSVTIPVGETGKLNISGSYHLFLTSNVSVLIEDAHLKKAACKVEGDIVLKASSTLAMNPIHKDTTILLKEIPLAASDHLTIGKIKIPLVITVTLRINLKVKADGTMELSAGWDYQNQSSATLAYDEGEIRLTGNFLEPIVNKFTKTSKVSGSFYAGLEAQAKASFFRKKDAALTAGLTLYGKLDGICLDSGISVKGTAGIEGTVGGQINLFNIFPLSGSVKVIDHSKEIFNTIVDDGGICTTQLPATAGSAGSHGDVHCYTFDGRVYDFQSFGEFVAVQGEGLTIQVRQGANNADKRVTFNKALAVSDGRDTVAFQLQPLALYINGVAHALTGRTPLTGRGYVESGSSTLTIQLSNGDRIDIAMRNQGYFDYQVSLVNSHRGKIAGLLGNWNGNLNDDIVLRNGNALPSWDFQSMYPNYANSWRITNSESLFHYDQGKSTTDYTDYSYPSGPIALTGNQVTTAQQICHAAGVTLQPALCNCILDVSVTGDAAMAESALQMQDKFQLLDPVLDLPLDGDAKDRSAWGNDGALVGPHTFIADRNGHPNSALSVSGAGYIDVPNNLIIGTLNHTLTVSGWVMATDNTGLISFVCKSYGLYALQLLLQVQLTDTSIGSNTTMVPLVKPFGAGVWHHVAMVLDNGVRTYYVDSVALPMRSQDVEANEGHLLFGRDPFSRDEYLKGALDEIKVYARALTKEEIWALANR